MRSTPTNKVNSGFFEKTWKSETTPAPPNRMIQEYSIN